MKQLKLKLIDWDKVRSGQLEAEIERLKQKINFLQHSRSSYIGKYKLNKIK